MTSFADLRVSRLQAMRERESLLGDWLDREFAARR